MLCQKFPGGHNRREEQGGHEASPAGGQWSWRQRGNGAISTDETEVYVRKRGKRESAWGSSGSRCHRAPHRGPRAGGDTVDAGPCSPGRTRARAWQRGGGPTAAVLGWVPLFPGHSWAPGPRSGHWPPPGTPFDSQHNRQGESSGTSQPGPQSSSQSPHRISQ